MKRLIWWLILVVAVVVIFVVVRTRNLSGTVQMYRDGTYTIEKAKVTLIDGRAEQPAAPGSAAKIITQYFGNEAFGDLNNDGNADVAFLLTQNSGGSGTFYYVAVALKSGDGYEGINTILLGDRIAPQTTEMKDGVITVNYADRNPGEPMTTRPSLGVSRRFRVTDDRLVELQ